MDIRKVVCVCVLACVTATGCSSNKSGDGSESGSGSSSRSGSSGPKMPLATSIAFDQASTSFAAFSSEEVRQAAMQYPAVVDAPVEAPISLTADDGTGLVLETLDARAVIEGPLAFTELHMQFRNPQPRVLEGRFQVTLPEGASVSRLSMKTSAGWQEAEMVERQAARRAYEDFLHRKQDPMLLEKEAGNQFRARIFPIPANGVKEVILSYSHELSSKNGYRLPLRGLPKIGELKVKAMVAEKEGDTTHYKAIEMQAKGTVPTKDFQVLMDTPLDALRQGTHVVARVRPKVDVSTSRLGSLTILFDTSASRAPGYARQVQRLGALVQAIASKQGSALRLRVAAFDQTTVSIFDGEAGEFGMQHLATLLSRRPLGASDLAGALRWAGERAPLDRLLIITDAVSTAGETELAGIAKALPDTITRIDTLLVGGIRDADAAARIVRGTRSQDGVVLRDDLENEEIARRLGDATASIEVAIAGAEWNWPQTVHGVQPGDEVVVYGAYGAGQAPAETVVEIQGADNVTMSSSFVPGQLLTRSVVQAQIARSQGQFIEEKDAAKKGALKASIISLSTKYRVLSDHTALLVLETDNDYRRFGIDRKALVDILIVQDMGLAIEQRQRSFPKTPPPPVQVARSAQRERGTEELDDSEDSGGTGTKMAEVEGRMGRRESSRATGQFAMRNNNADPQLARPQPSSGVMPSPSSQAPGGAFAAITGAADFSSGLDDRDVFGGLLGDKVGEMAGGYGISGAGTGGGGTSWGTIGSGNYATIGHGSSSGSGTGAHSMRGRRATSPTVRIGAATSEGSLDANIIRRYTRRKLPRIRHCYERELLSNPNLAGTVTTKFTITSQGQVKSASSEGIDNRSVTACVTAAIKSIQFPKPRGGGTVTVSYSFQMAPSSSAPQEAPVPTEPQAWGNTGEEQPAQELHPTVDPNIAAKAAESNGPPALTGQMATIHQAIEAGHFDKAVSTALAWRTEESGNVMAIVALGESLEAAGQLQLAARAYGSIIDLFPSRSDLRRFASTRLISLTEVGEGLSVDSLQKAAEQRPDHLSVHRLLGYALLRSGDLEAAFTAVEKGLQRSYPDGRFAGGTRILQDDLGIIGRAWLAKDAGKESEILKRLKQARAKLATEPSLRFVLNWETDANDVDFHIYDGQGGHAFYSAPRLSSGGELYADVTTGYGPECFAIKGPTLAFPYALQIHYYSRGPMGYGMGQVEILQHDGKGGLKFDARPFVVMNDNAYLALGPINGPLK